MAHSKSAMKRVRQNEKRRVKNKSQRSALRTQLRKTKSTIESKNVETAQAELTKSVRALDRAASKGLIHPNQAARRKSRMVKKVQKLSLA